jgi:hypothetical protein
MYVVYLAAAALIGAVINILFFGAPLADALLAWLLGVQVGLGAIWAFLGHYFKSDEVAAYIGWPPGNPFQKEIAFTNLALGLCGVLSFLLRNTPLRDGFWLATILFATVFLCGDAGPVFFADIGMPALLWVLYLVR